MAELILPDGGRIHFDRTSSGTSYATAMFKHRATPTNFYGARLGWTGLGWAMRFADDSVAAFRDCSTGGHDVCSLIWLRAPDGHVLQFRRNRERRLIAIDGPSDHVTFTYDDHNRIIAATVDGGTRGVVWL